MKYTLILIKETKEQNCWIKLFHDLRTMVKVFSILALTESLILTLTSYVHYKTIFAYSSPWFFLFEEEIMVCYLDIWIFVLLWNPQILKFVTSPYALVHNGSYTFAYFFWTLSGIKILVYKNTWSNTTMLCEKHF